MATMNISLPEKLKSFVEKQVASGNFSNVSDYVRDLLRKEQERQDMIKEIQLALDEAEAGGFVPYVREDLEKRFEELAKAQSKKSAA